ncbi:VWA domain-containing protein [Campylobacterota bacterium]
MSFLYPIFIYLMLPILLILFYFIMTGSKENLSMFGKDVLDKLRSENKSLSRTARSTLFLIAFIFMIFALAQPVIKEGEITVEAKSADILIGIDISDSMKAEDSYPNRLDFAKNKAIDLIKQAPHNRIGVLAFAKHDYIVSPLSFDHSSVAFLLSKVKTDNITEKGTHLDSMIGSAISMLEHAEQKNLLLFTDGGDSEDFDKEISLAKENGLRLFIIGVGSEKGSPVRSSDGGFVKHNGDILISKLNPQIKSLATQTGGVYIESVLGDGDIKAMLKEIESMTEKSTLKEEKIPQYTQLFYYPLALATLFLFLAFSSFPQRAVKSVAILALVFIGLGDAKAGLLDFQKLENAKEAYANEEYDKSSSIYEGFAKDSSEATYNLANSLYKSKEYEKALEAYESVQSENSEIMAKSLHNSGNAHVNLKQYKEALASYEKALELQEDAQTRANYDTVKKFLEEQQDQNEEKDKSENTDQDNKSEQSEESSEKSDSQQQENAKDKESKQDQDSSQKSEQYNESSQDSESEKSKENKEEDKTNSSDEQNQDKESQVKEEGQQKSEQQKDQEHESKESEAKAASVNMKKMSDLEAKKWLKMIQQSQKGHLYKMQDAQHKEDENEKPW